ncbi:MAG: DUF998 domain-containing protein [Kribbellaceae bacterium]
MSVRTATPPVTSATNTSRLLACGIAASVLFPAASFVQSLTRDGYDLSRHPVSLLSLGEHGWLQITNFVVTGLLYLACAAGLRRLLGRGPAGTWGPRLVATIGAGMIAAGVFLTDAGAGFPAGAPDGAPERISWHGILHELGFLAVTVAWTAAAFVFRRRFAALGQRLAARLCVAAVVAVFVVIGWPHLDSLSVRLLAGAAVQAVATVALLTHLLRSEPAQPVP